MVALALVPAAAAATARERPVAGPIETVSITGTEIAYADEYRKRCHEIRLWDVALRGDRRLASHCFVSTSTGSGVARCDRFRRPRAVADLHRRKHPRMDRLWTKGRNAKARRIAFKAADVDGPAPIILGRAWEGSLPYATGNTIVVLAPDGSRRFTLTAPDRVVSLSAHSRGYAAVLASGERADDLGSQASCFGSVSSSPGFVQEALLAAPGLIVTTRTGLEIHNGDSIRLVPLPRARGSSATRRGSRPTGPGVSSGSSGSPTATTRSSARSSRASRPSSAGAESSTSRSRQRSGSPPGPS